MSFRSGGIIAQARGTARAISRAARFTANRFFLASSASAPHL
ncbi:hypothetical protein Z947_623 [Sulfitobacter geojensis]|nr:hypothetical protein Z947_623 [Sulfitobacter geojensis]